MRITLNDRDRRRFAALREVQELNAAVLELYSRYLNQAPCAVTADEVRELSAACGVDHETAWRMLFAACCGLDGEKNPLHRRVMEQYLTPSVRLLDVQAYRSNPYLTTVCFPEGQVGKWTLKTQRYQPGEAFIRDDLVLRPDLTELPLMGFFMEKFDYPAVLENGREWMTITPNEIESMAPAIAAAHGHVCAFGLGLGYFAFMASNKDNVSRVTVVERDPSVIELFKTHILPRFPHKEKVDIVDNDAFLQAKAGLHGADFAFVDLWHDVADGTDMYCRMKKLEKYSPDTEFSYWIESSILSHLRFELFAVMEDALAGCPGENPFPETEEWRLKSYDDIVRGLGDDTLRLLAAGRKIQ